MGLRNKFLISTTGVILLLGVVTITFIYLSQSKTLTKSLLAKINKDNGHNSKQEYEDPDVLVPIQLVRSL